MNRQSGSSVPQAWLHGALIVFACMLFATGAVAATRFTILAQPVKVVAQSDSKPGDPARFFPFALTVSHGGRSFTFRTLLIAVADRHQALAVLRQTIGWKDGYLFVRQECGGGNRWRCDVDQVFALRDGRLIHIGEQLGGRREQGPGAFFHDGYFTDVYDRFESNDLTSHAGAPSFTIYIKENNGSFVVDLTRTWAGNRDAFKRDRNEIPRVAQNHEMDPRTRAETLASLLLHNAILARYCLKPHLLAQTMWNAADMLPPGKQKIFKRIVGGVLPGQLPSPRGAVDVTAEN
ncbi:MAG TPA: hypothetical protein VFW88_08925 [Burkholderiales bacterium]|nr:hypothetical protein [Burkholderiales bacterium]